MCFQHEEDTGLLPRPVFLGGLLAPTDLLVMELRLIFCIYIGIDRRNRCRRDVTSSRRNRFPSSAHWTTQ
ncbi:hypothetical protein BDR05DRAFT_595683 [Suillus weaverae]|nr:hypothetical protein BDR05DRAFT_595683 [Suillus weaverae]